jgi:GntR family transcriptional regulator
VSDVTGDRERFGQLPDLTAVTDEPTHTRIEQWLAGVIGAGTLTAGDRLPPEGDFAATLGVSRMTLRQALGALEARGLVERKRGRSGGTFVTRPRIECDLTGLPGFTEQMRRAQVKPGARVIRAELTPAPDRVARALDLPRGAPVYVINRVRLANREPLALEETYLSAEDFPDLLERRLTGSLYTLMRRRYDLAPFSAREWLEPVSASDEDAALLGIEPGMPLMLVTRTAYTEPGKPVEHAYDRYRGDRTRIALQTGITQANGRRSAVEAELTADRSRRR